VESRVVRNIARGIRCVSQALDGSDFGSVSRGRLEDDPRLEDARKVCDPEE